MRCVFGAGRVATGVRFMRGGSFGRAADGLAEEDEDDDEDEGPGRYPGEL